MYKAELPEKTIQQIQDILDQLGIEVTVTFFEVKDMTWSCRLQVVGRYQSLGLGTNGKGMTQAYAKASAYGELMERIQNKLLVFTTKYSNQDFILKRHPTNTPSKNEALSFRYFPDEKTTKLDISLLDKWVQQLLPEHSRLDTTTSKEYVISYVLYKELTTGESYKIPYDLIRYAAGSTGMCAGNTPEEAILQGTFEIIERYVLQRIYIDKPILPTVPLSCFEGTEIGNRINTMIEATGWKVIVKDCSLDKGYPVLGLLIIDMKSDRYTFRLGSDISPDIALQRCFTEIFQGIGLSSESFQKINLLENWIPGEQYRISMESGRGEFPTSIFIDKNLDDDIIHNGVFISHKEQEASFPVKGNSIEENYENMLEWIKKRDLILYVRDNSYLGFPTYHLYIPGMSSVDEQLFDVMTVLPEGEHYYDIKPEYRLKKITKVEAIDLIDKYKNYPYAVVRLFDYSTGGFNFFNRNLLLALLSFFVGNNKDASLFMDYFLKDSLKTGRRQTAYYYCIRDYFSILSSYARIPSDAQAVLQGIYGASLSSEVINDMSDPSLVFDSFPIPNGFDCYHCPVKDNCSFDIAVDFERLIQRAQLKYFIQTE